MLKYCHEILGLNTKGGVAIETLEYTYDAFGNTIAQSGAMADAFVFRFSTKYLDAETGLYYYGYRFYSPELMRWLNRDPIEEAGGVNLYAFCGNNAIVHIDRQCLFGCCNGKRYNSISHCCVDNTIYSREKQYSGISVWSQYDRGIGGLLSHAWIETDDGNSYGFYPKTSFDASSGSPEPFAHLPSRIASPDPYAGKSKDGTFKEKRKTLSPCMYDFAKIKRCIAAVATGTPKPYVLAWYNCSHWANETVNFCIKFGKR